MVSSLILTDSGDMSSYPKGCKINSSDIGTGSSTHEESHYLKCNRPKIGGNHFNLSSPIYSGQKTAQTPKKIKRYKDNSNDIFNSPTKESFGLRNDLIPTNFIDQVFKDYDDPYAKLPAGTPGTMSGATPKKVLLISPHKTTPHSSFSDRYISLQERLAKRRALMAGEKDFIEMLQRTGHDIAKCFPSSKKKTNKKVNFECSTPVRPHSSNIQFMTPLADRSCEVLSPLSGMKNLFFTPLSEKYVNNTCYSSCRSDLSLSSTLSPVHNLPPDIKSTILIGVTCFVDVKSEKENRSECVKIELISLGAKVEKTFNKKVTHVIFKEGRVSIYLKAKKEGIPLVSVLWIEACKEARGVVDHTDYRPKKMEKYDNLLPFQTIKKRKLHLISEDLKRKLDAITGDSVSESPSSPTISRELRSKRRAITEAKDIDKRTKDSLMVDKPKHCNKRLQFDNLANQKVDGTLPTPLDYAPEENNCDDSDSLSAVKSAAHLRRKSAPAKLARKRNKGIQEPEKKNEQSENNEDIPLAKCAIPVSADVIEFDKTSEIDELVKNMEKKLNRWDKKKKKLFNPSEFDLMHSSDADAESIQDDYEVSIPEFIETKEDKSIKKSTLKRTKEVKKKQNRIKDMESPSDTKRNSSATWFKDRSPGSTSKKPKEPSCIVFTSIPKSNLKNIEEKVEKLGMFVVESSVTRKTTHVVSNGTRRTLNLVKGMARGCWLVDVQWIIQSEKNGRWLQEESFELISFSPAVTECRLIRQVLKTSSVLTFLGEVGPLYVSRKSLPPPKELEELIRLCGGSVVSTSKTAVYIVGGRPLLAELTSIRPRVSEKWILDSITRGRLLSHIDYIIKTEPSGGEPPSKNLVLPR